MIVSTSIFFTRVSDVSAKCFVKRAVLPFASLTLPRARDEDSQPFLRYRRSRPRAGGCGPRDRHAGRERPVLLPGVHARRPEKKRKHTHAQRTVSRTPISPPQILQHHFPGRELRRDIAEVTELPADTELLAAGFPCPVRPHPSPRKSPNLLRENPQTFSEKNTKSASQPVRTRIAPHAGRQHVQQRPPRPQKRQQDRPLRAHLPGPPQDPRAVGLTGERTRFADVAHERRPPRSPPRCRTSSPSSNISDTGGRSASSASPGSAYPSDDEGCSYWRRRTVTRATCCWRRKPCALDSASSCSNATRRSALTSAGCPTGCARSARSPVRTIGTR